MRVLMIVLLFVSLLQVEARSASAARCGKGNRPKGKYGKEKVFTSPTLRTGRCRYKIRVPRGLSVQLTLKEFDVNPCCLNVSIYDAAVPLFKWTRAKKLSMPAGPQPAGTVVVFETSTIGLQLDAARKNSPISFTYGAVIPSSGSFGFDVTATKKRQTIRSPGYPKINLPSGVRSRWSILSKGPFAISLAFRGLITASDADYIEVYDGNRLLQRHSGKMNKKSPIEHLAFSGSMKVYLHTETGNSKGFKAVFQLLGNATMPVIPTEIAGGLRCHQRNRIMSQGSTISDQQSEVTCTGDQICARMVIEGQASVLGTPQTTMSETLSCMPRQVCSSNLCDTMPSSPGVTITSCEVSCCSTDMCNRSPNGPNVGLPSPSPTVSFPPVWPTTVKDIISTGDGLRCHQKSEFIQEGAIALGLPEENNYCAEEEVCALYVYHGTLRNNFTGVEEPIAGQYAGCTARSHCNKDGCVTLPDAGNAEITSCVAKCCGRDMCNTPGERPMPSPMPGSTLRCYDILLAQSGKLQVLNKKEVIACEDTASKCLRVDATATDGNGRDIVMTYGGCIPSFACASVDCSLLTGAMPGVSLSSCKTSCCDTDLCNEKKAPAIPERPDVVLRCHQRTEFVREGAVGIDGSAEPSATCQAGMLCGLYVYHGISTVYGDTESVAGQTATCISKSKCNSDGCAGLPDAARMNITKCKASCCNSDMCNVPQETPIPSPQPAPGIKCYEIMEMRGLGMLLPGSQKSLRECDAGWQCMLVHALAVHESFSSAEISIVYGTCVPACSAEGACDSIPSATAGVTIKACGVSCCQTDYCNIIP